MSRYRTEDGTVGTTDGLKTEIITPRAEELRHWGTDVKLCGTCRYFDHEQGQKEIMQQQLAERLTREEGWKLHHLGSRLQDLGLCGAGDGDTLTGRMHKSCSQYRETHGRVEKQWKGI
jgi:hypothetical protein